MKIALAQIDIVPGKPDLNVQKMLDYIEKAKDEQCDLVCFPEMAVGGYLLGDLYTDDDYCRGLMEWNNPVIKASDGITVAWGNVYLDETIKGNDGRLARFNAAYVYSDRKPTDRGFAYHTGYQKLTPGVTFKTLLPNYRFFDDERYFTSGSTLYGRKGIAPATTFAPFIVHKRNADGTRSVEMEKVGVELCEDIWCKDYDINPTKYLAENSDVIINLSASPWTYGKHKARDNAVEYVAGQCTYTSDSNQPGSQPKTQNIFPPLFYVNCVGVQNNGKNIITFDGGSTVYNRTGKPCLFLKDAYCEDLLIADSNDLPRGKNRPKNNKIEEKYKAIIRGIQGFKDMVGMPKHPRVVIGMSGGIDSALSAALFVKAIGKENVIGINMPTKYNSDATKTAAEKVAKALDIHYGVINIESLVQGNKTALMKMVVDMVASPQDIEGFGIQPIVDENIQAKIRATGILSNYAQMVGGIFSNNGNKVEVALGYATLYGDWGGAIAPLADLTKSEVYDMAKYVNKLAGRKNIIPPELLPDSLYQFACDQIKPSAELKDNQVDPIKVEYHCQILEYMMKYTKTSLADILQYFIDGTLEANLEMKEGIMRVYGINDPEVFLKDIEWFIKQMESQVFKRVQSVPGIVTSQTAFGYDLRESILPPGQRWTLKAKRLAKQILKMKKLEHMETTV